MYLEIKIKSKLPAIIIHLHVLMHMFIIVLLTYIEQTAFSKHKKACSKHKLDYGNLTTRELDAA